MVQANAMLFTPQQVHQTLAWAWQTKVTATERSVYGRSAWTANRVWAVTKQTALSQVTRNVNKYPQRAYSNKVRVKTKEGKHIGQKIAEGKTSVS